MKHKLKKELHDLRKEMISKFLAPSKKIISDNQSHTYPIFHGGALKFARYTATPYPFENELNEPILVCSYGLLEERGGGYSYSSLMKK